MFVDFLLKLLTFKFLDRYLLDQEKLNSNEQMKLKMSQFQKDFESLNLQHQVQLTEKKTQLEVVMTRLQSQPQLEKLIKE